MPGTFPKNKIFPNINLERDIEQVQRRAARFVSNCYQDASPGCVTRLLDKLQWEPLLLRRNRLVMANKIQNRLVESNLSDFTHLVMPALGEDNTFVSNIPTKIFTDTPSFPGSGVFYQTR